MVKRDNIRPRTCRECGKVFPGGPRAWYCPDCRADRAKESCKRSKARAKKGLTRALGSTDFCVICNKPYIVFGANQKYCKECAPEAITEVDKKQSLEYYLKNKDTYNPKRNEARRIKEKECAICGKIFIPDGSPRKTCSSGCDDVLRKIRQRKAERKRASEVKKMRNKIAWERIKADPEKIAKYREYQREYKKRKYWEEKNRLGITKRDPKKQTTIRFDADILEIFEADKKGWQTRINNALREWVEIQNILKK